MCAGSSYGIQRKQYLFGREDVSEGRLHQIAHGFWQRSSRWSMVVRDESGRRVADVQRRAVKRYGPQTQVPHLRDDTGNGALKVAAWLIERA